MSGSYHGERKQSTAHRSNTNAEPHRSGKRYRFAHSSRRLFLAAGTAAAVFATVKRAAATPSDDALIIALSAEVLRLNAIVDDIAETRIEPFEDEFKKIMLGDNRMLLNRDEQAELVKQAFAFSRECGHEAAIEEQDGVWGQADTVFKRMMAMTCTTQPARAAKVRALLVHVMHAGWRGPTGPMDWHREQARALLGEFAGMSAEDLANV